MEKMTRKVIAILTVGALLFALPFAVAADIVEYPEQGVEEAVPAPAELPPAEEPVAAPAELPPEEPMAEEPAEEPAEDVPDEASEDALDEEALEEEDLEEELLADEDAAEDDDLVEIAQFSAELQVVIDSLQELRDEINWAIDAIESVGPEGFTAEQWAAFQHNLAVWNNIQGAPFVEIDGVVVAEGFDEVFDWLLANWGALDSASQDAILNMLMNDLYIMENEIKPAFFQFLDILCELPDNPNCACPLCTRPPPPPPPQPDPDPPVADPPVADPPVTAPPVADPPAAPPAANVVGTAPQTGDTTSAQVPFVKLMMSLFAISGLSLVKVRMRNR